VGIRHLEHGLRTASNTVIGVDVAGIEQQLRNTESGRTYLVRREHIYYRRCTYLEEGLTCRGAG
jgi:hypothetical protein